MSACPDADAGEVAPDPWAATYDALPEDTLETWSREAARVSAELRAWAKRDRDGWDVARGRSGRAVAAPWAGARGKAAALRGSQASARAGRGLPRGGREYRRGPLSEGAS